MKRTAQKRIIEAARGHISGCVGEAKPADAYDCWETGDLPQIKGRTEDQIRERLAAEIKRQLARRRSL